MGLKLVGNQFGNSLGFAGERQDEYPSLMRWDRSAPTAGDTVVFTDSNMREHKEYPGRKHIALLVESPAIRPEIYQWIRGHYREFDAVLTHQTDLVEMGKPFLFYPLGGSWIKEWGVFPKTKMFSILVSKKTGQEGHRLRHEAAKLPGVDAYGEGVGRRVESKIEALRDYRFVIVAENCVSDAYFTEKLIDAFSQGCIPLYRGCPSVGKFFNQWGIYTWRNMQDLAYLVEWIRPADYIKNVREIKENLGLAHYYQCPEDWIVRNYKGLLA